MKLFGRREAQAPLAVGQEWRYRTRAEEPDSTLVIGRVEREGTATVVHISVLRVRISNPNSPTGIAEVIAHLPMSEDAVRQSITKLKGSVQLDDEFEEGYRQWQEAEGGAFSISVAEAVSTVEELLLGAAGRAT